MSGLDLDRTYFGTVKFFKAEKGWGGIESTETPFDIWVPFSAIEGDGHRALVAGERVEFRWEAVSQDSWRGRAVWVRRLDPLSVDAPT